MNKTLSQLQQTQLSPSKLKEVAVRASVDPRTLERFLQGLPVKGMAAERCFEALRAAGLIPALAGKVG